MSAFELLVVDSVSGIPSYPLPDRTDLKFSPVFSAVGVVTFNYPDSGVNSVRLRPSVAEADVEIAVMLNGTEIYDLRFVISEYTGDEANAAEEGFSWGYTGRTMMCLLERAIVYPPGFGTAHVEDTKKFTNGTAGEIMGTLIVDAQARGAIPQLVIGSFSQTHDSNGVLWTKQITIEYRAGLEYVEVLLNLIDQGMVEAKMVQRELRLYNPGTLTTDLTLQNPPVIFRKGRDLSDAPRSVDKNRIASVFLAGGSEGIYAEAINVAAEAVFGRIESFDSQGGVSDPGTLASYAQAQRDLRAQVTMEKSHGLVFGGGCPEPVTDFNLGDYVWSDTNGTLERLRVKQWVVSETGNGDLEGVVVLGDLFSELQDDIVKRVKGILGGTTLTGESRATDTTEIIDTIAPGAPTSVVLSSDVYDETTGGTYAQITATWTAPATNTDGSPADDINGYYVRFKYDLGQTGTDWTGSYFTETTTMSLSPFLTNSLVHVQVRAVDRSGNLSAWSADQTIITADDTTPPPVPSTPTVVNYLGVLRATWDGLGSVGQQMGSDFKFIEVHISDVNNFTPGPATLRDYLSAAGVSVLVPVSTPKYNTDNYVKFISVDTSNNKSAASSQGSGKALQVVETDIGNNVIDFDNIKFKDLGNLIPDGSFELPETAAYFATVSYYDVGSSPVGGQSPNGLFVNPAGAGVTIDETIVVGIPCAATQQFALIRSHENVTNVNGTSRLSMRIKRYYANGTNDNVEIDFYNSTSNGVGWHYRTATYFTIPANCFKFDFYLELSDFTTGQYFLDDMEIRPVTGTALIQDLAVTTAKIALLAVNDAQIGSASIGKLTTGTLTADMIIGARIKTANTGVRVEVNTSGVMGYDSSNNNTVQISSSTGQITGLGTFSAGSFTGNQVRMSSVGPWGDPAVWFVQPSNSWGYAPTVYSAVGDGSLRMISAETTQNSSGRSQLWMFQDRFELTTQFINNATAAESKVATEADLRLRSGSGNTNHPVSINIGGSGSSTMGEFLIYGRLPTGFISTSFQHMYIFASPSGAAAGSVVSASIGWGPTWARGNPITSCSGQRGSGAMTTWCNAISSTATGVAAYQIQAGSANVTINVVGWQY